MAMIKTKWVSTTHPFIKSLSLDVTSSGELYLTHYQALTLLDGKGRLDEAVYEAVKAYLPTLYVKGLSMSGGAYLARR
jgi:hypothetical protein